METKKDMTQVNIMANVIFMMVDMLETNMMNFEEELSRLNAGLKFETKRDFNVAMNALRRMKREISHCSERTQLDYGDDSDMTNTLLLTIIDRVGRDDSMLFKFYNYIKNFPSRLNMKLDDRGVFDRAMKGMEL